jgi:hypothetical protein
LAELDTAIAQLAEAFLTSQFSNISVLGMSTGQNGDRADLILQTLEAARQMKVEADPTTGDAAAAIALDAKTPLGVNFDFSPRQIE